jgi:ankyrin repeat protein
MPGALRAAGLAAALALAHAAPALAHESEQYTMPVGRDFADLGPYFSRIVFDAIVSATARTNDAIADAVEGGASSPSLPQLQSADYIAGRVWEQLFIAMPTNELLDLQLASESVRAQFPGLVTVHQPARSIYNDPLLVIDLTKFVRTFFRAGTVSAGGTEFGTDKLIHFINIGRIYHAKYETRRERGLPEDDAVRSAIASTSRNPLLSEDGVLGMFTTGIRSNGDLAADFAGLKFYRNLTEEVRIGQRVLPPMLVREGPYWRVRIDPHSDFFTVFITPHWNETLNPNRYMGYTRGRIRALVRERCADALDWYRDERGQPRSRAQFEAIERELSTFYGEDYEHRGSRDPVSIASACFPNGDTGAVTAAAASGAAPPGLGRSELWWAARSGDAEWVQALVRQRTVLDAPDNDGETPLHAGVRSGSTAVVGLLLAQGADPNRAAGYGVTPLMLASTVSRTEIAAALLQAGAKPNERDLFGKSALFDALMRGNTVLTHLLLDHGADPGLADDAGNTPLHVAARRGDEGAVQVLLNHGADAGARNAAGATALAEAQRLGHTRVAELLQPHMGRAVAPAPGSVPTEPPLAYGMRPEAAR